MIFSHGFVCLIYQLLAYYYAEFDFVFCSLRDALMLSYLLFLSVFIGFVLSWIGSLYRLLWILQFTFYGYVCSIIFGFMFWVFWLDCFRSSKLCLLNSHFRKHLWTVSSVSTLRHHKLAHEVMMLDLLAMYRLTMS